MTTKTITPEHYTSLSKAKIRLMEKTDATFFMEIAFSFRYEFTYSVGTAATDGVVVYLNPDFWMKHNIEQQVGLILHETLHPAYEHLTRRAGRDPKLWNIAGDHRINLDLLERKFQLPPGGYHDPKYGKQSTDEIYNDLLKQQQANPQKFQGQMQGIGDDLLPTPDGLTPQQLADQIETTLVRAALRSEQDGDKPGSIPGDLQIFIDKLKSPKLPWQQLLVRWMRDNKGKNGVTWLKPARRYLPDLYLPARQSPSLMSLAVIVDTSGSISQAQFDDFIGEAGGILRMLKPPQIDFVQFDTKIQGHDTVKDLDALKGVKFSGRGGTQIGPVFDWIEEHKPKLALIFTDGEFRWPDHVPQGMRHSAVLWIKHGSRPFNPSLGQVIQYE